jgi:multiple sugar transport system substrate-binding protein
MSKRFLLYLLPALFLLPGCGKDGADIATTPIALEIWGVFDTESAYTDVMNAYRQIHPNVSITYKKFRFEEYEQELIRALAEGRGPDMFLLHHTWLPAYKTLILPLPDSLTIGYQEVRGAIKKQVVNAERTEPTISQRDLESRFVDVILDDILLPYAEDGERNAARERVFALPTSLDTLALFWNRDLFNAAGIAEPPKTWSAFQEAVSALTVIDPQTGKIEQSAVGLGTSENVERSIDILTLLMMQNGTQMTDARGDVAFHLLPQGLERTSFPGLDAVRFYTDFANPTKAVYTWSANQPDAFQAFVNGTAAMFFGYSYHIPLIKLASPKLNFATAEMPQIENGRKVNLANFWGMSVSKDSENWNWAWDFAQFLTADAEQNAKYLSATNKPPALRQLIADQLQDEFLAPFASQVLTAKSWYHGEDAATAERALKELIDHILDGTMEGMDAINLAASKVAQTL